LSKGVFKGRNHNSRRWEGRCWKIPKIPHKSHKEVQSHRCHKEYLVIVNSQDSF
ncbi:mCG1042580, partial [Mus musculus]